MSIRNTIIALHCGRTLTHAEAAAATDTIMRGDATPGQIGAFLMALSLRGETADEIAGMASTLRQHALRVSVAGPLLDTCGTGGDSAGTFNISTTAAFVAAGAGARVAKHGNRAMSSACGSADVLEALGVQIDLDAARVARCIEQAGIGFMFAPNFHPALRHAGPVRREIGIRTAFNLLGPLANPAAARHQVLGVPTLAAATLLAGALARLGTTHTLVIAGHDGLDELALDGPNTIIEVRDTQIAEPYTLNASDLGIAPAARTALAGGDAAANAALTRAILSGAERGAPRAVVLLNAAAALIAADLADSWPAALALATAALDAGRAAAALDALVRVSHGG